MSTEVVLFDVGGVLLNQPFKIRRLGHFGFNVYKIDECLEFYRDFLGFKVSDENDFKANPDPKIQEWLKDVKSGKGYFMGDFIGLEVTIKSKEHFPDEPGNWAYFSFGHEYPLAQAAKPFETLACNRLDRIRLKLYSAV